MNIPKKKIHRRTPKKRNEDVLSFNSAISACEKSMEWRWALELLKDGADFTGKKRGRKLGKRLEKGWTAMRISWEKKHGDSILEK